MRPGALQSEKLNESPPVWIGEEVFEQLDHCLQQLAPSKIWILADENTSEKCLPVLEGKISRLAEAALLRISSGEQYKSLGSCQYIWDELSRNGADRKSLLCNLGGGIIGDLGGFSASVFLRGIPFIQIPTTLLAMVDASIGGKTGINFSGLKNQIGTFQQPAGIFIQTRFLESLPGEELVSGYAEMVKHALIEGGEHWEMVKAFHNLHQAGLEPLIRESVRLKLDITARDFREAGLREVLNLGHTTAHALEALYFSAGKQIMHGNAVAAGMAVETYLAEGLASGLSEAASSQIRQYIYTIFPPVHFNPDQVELLIKFMDHDKKNKNGNIRFTLLEGIGKPKHGCTAGADLIRDALLKYRADVSAS